MDLPVTSGDALAQPTRARIFACLVERRKATGTEELAAELDLHPNGVRRHLERLEGAGLVERRRRKGGRGRPSDVWSVAPGAHPGGERPSAYADLSRWLVRALPSGARGLREVEKAGREIGRELAPSDSDDPVESFRQVISALGFKPVLNVKSESSFSCTLKNCPYRDSVRENPDIVCSLHRGITSGLLDELDPGAKLVRFEPHDPERAGCVVTVSGSGSK